MKRDFYQFSATNLQGQKIAMKEYRGKVMLVVNTASKCALSSQLRGLEILYKKYAPLGFVVLGFPCNQFTPQESRDAQNIAEEYLLNYGASFPLFTKTEVVGKGAHPLFSYLENRLEGIMGPDIKWNFTKFLIDHRGDPVKRFAPITAPAIIAPDIEILLSAQSTAGEQ
ncbi:glutathione peroxidase [Desulfotalea psychrophila]|nr:glutathione peroxidase [Desulfotalea psychrophila]